MKLNNSRTVDFSGLTTVGTPQATRTWQPVPHHDIMTTVIDHAKSRNLQIDELTYELVDVYKDKVQQPYPDMFARMYMKSDNGVYRNMLGIRNSHNKKYGASACSGTSVMVCSNGVMSAEHMISSKHTPHVRDNFDQAVSNMFDNVIASWKRNECRYNGYRATELSEAGFDQILGAAIREGAINPSKSLKVYQEYIDPRHDAFADRNAWSAFNAFTEIHKESPFRLDQPAARGQALHNVFDAYCADAIDAEMSTFNTDYDGDTLDDGLDAVDVQAAQSQHSFSFANN